MNDFTNEYAGALFTLAEENGELTEVSQAMGEISRVLADHPEYVDLLSSPTLSREERNASLDQVFQDMPEHVSSFMKLFCDHGHARDFQRFYVEFDALVQYSARRVMARVTSAVPLTETEKAALVEQLEKKSGKKVWAEYRTDPSLLGGVTVEMDGFVLDGSLRRRLEEVKEVIAK